MSIFLETFTYILNGWSLNRRCAYFYQNSPCCGMCRRQIKNQKIKNHISSCLDHKSNNEQRIIIVCLPGSWYVSFARIYPLFDFHPNTSKQANNSTFLMRQKRLAQQVSKKIFLLINKKCIQWFQIWNMSMKYLVFPSCSF